MISSKIVPNEAFSTVGRQVCARFIAILSEVLESKAFADPHTYRKNTLAMSGMTTLASLYPRSVSPWSEPRRISRHTCRKIYSPYLRHTSCGLSTALSRVIVQSGPSKRAALIRHPEQEHNATSLSVRPTNSISQCYSRELLNAFPASWAPLKPAVNPVKA